jgi:hypothetical protein
MKGLHMVTFTLVVLGALNWGLVGLFNYNLVEALLGTTGLVGLAYTLVGASAVWIAVTHGQTCKLCGTKK